jgi:hypothetical protein
VLLQLPRADDRPSALDPVVEALLGRVEVLERGHKGLEERRRDRSARSVEGGYDGHVVGCGRVRG